jgi:hypothetical protein
MTGVYRVVCVIALILSTWPSVAMASTQETPPSLPSQTVVLNVTPTASVVRVNQRYNLTVTITNQSGGPIPFDTTIFHAVVVAEDEAIYDDWDPASYVPSLIGSGFFGTSRLYCDYGASMCGIRMKGTLGPNQTVGMNLTGIAPSDAFFEGEAKSIATKVRVRVNKDNTLLYDNRTTMLVLP